MAASLRLFNGHDLGGWRMRTAHATNWTVSNGELVNLRAGSNLVSTELFGDFRLHLEYNCPPHSNSGVFLRGRYEVQIFDEPEADAMSRTGAIYNVLPAEGPKGWPGEWQSMDIELVGRRVTVVLNGNTVIDRKLIPKVTGGALDTNEDAPGPIFLQGDHGPVRFRNIVITPAAAPHGRFYRWWWSDGGVVVNAAERMMDGTPESRSNGMLTVRMEEDPKQTESVTFAAEVEGSPGLKTPRVIVNGRSTYFFGESEARPWLELRPRDVVPGVNALQFTCDSKMPVPGWFRVKRAALVAELKPGHPALGPLAGCEFHLDAQGKVTGAPRCLAEVERVESGEIRFRGRPELRYQQR